MKLAINALSFGPKIRINMDLMKHAESLGFDSVWTAEAYGNDAVTTATWVAGADRRSSRSERPSCRCPRARPAMTAMTAMTLDQLSGGRFMLGLGPSGPQVVEGWHGVPYGKPLTRTREYIAIIRKILDAQGARRRSTGEYYQIPNTGPGTTGLGKPLKSILHGDPTSIPIYTASISPNGLALRGRGGGRRVSDDGRPRALRAALEAEPGGGLREGRRRQVARRTSTCMPFVTVIVGDDLEKAHDPVKEPGALHRRHGCARQELLQRLHEAPRLRRGGQEDPGSLSSTGRRPRPMAAVPDELRRRGGPGGPEGSHSRSTAGLEGSGRREEVGAMLIGGGRRRRSSCWPRRCFSAGPRAWGCRAGRRGRTGSRI